MLLADSPFAVSAVTYMELVQGMRNRREFAKLVLVSSNSKHFRPIQGLRLERFRPRQYPV